MDTQRQKSSTSVSAILIAVENQDIRLPVLSTSAIDENQNIVWPVLSTSEVQDSTRKRAWHPTAASCTSAEIYFEKSDDLAADRMKHLENGNKCKSEKQDVRYKRKIDEIICPVLERTILRARHATSRPSEEISSEPNHLAADSISILETSNEWKSEILHGHEEQDNEPKIETWTLRKSSHLCNPFVLDAHGRDFWRDFL
jgi:hypothetical protein